MALVAIASIAGWWLHDSGSTPERHDAATRPGASGPPPAFASSDAPDRAVSVHALTLRPAASASPDVPTQVEVCSAGRLDVPIGGESSLAHLQQLPAVHDARQRLLARLRSSADAFDRAMAVFLQDDLGAADRSDRAEQIARLAQDSPDARLAGLAVRVCHASRQRKHCAAVDARRWTVLAPDNGLAWIYAIDAAWQSHDPVAAQRGLAGLAANATHESAGFADLARVLVAHSPEPMTDADLLAEVALWVDGLGRFSGLGEPLQGLLSLCRRDLAGQEPRAALCKRAAYALSREPGDSVEGPLQAVTLARRVGGPPDWGAAWLAAQEADELLTVEVLDGSARCDALRRQDQALRRWAEPGVRWLPPPPPLP